VDTINTLYEASEQQGRTLTESRGKNDLQVRYLTSQQISDLQNTCNTLKVIVIHTGFCDASDRAYSRPRCARMTEIYTL
jgi:hypothetical protein